MGKRRAIAQGDRLRVWASAAGRCTFCNRSVLENDDLGLEVRIGELAHAVGHGATSPRGDSALAEGERAAAENLVLLCRTCHKPVDDKGVVGLYTVDVLLRLKREHEERIRFLTDIGADRRTHLVRVVGPIRGSQPELSYESVLEATTAAELFPTPLGGSWAAEVELDLRQQPENYNQGAFEEQARQLLKLTERIHDGVRRGEISHLSVFGFARIPILVALGAQLDDKIETRIFQRHRTDDGNPWRWPAEHEPPPSFSIDEVSHDGGVTLILNVSGAISDADVPEELRSDTQYRLIPSAPAVPHPCLLDSPAALASFEQSLRTVLARIELNHGRIETIGVLAAIPVSAAITLGRVLMPEVSPSLTIYDRNEDGAFFRALEVRR